MSTVDYLLYPQLWDGLVTSIKQKVSGTFLIATSDNTSCRFALDAGRVTHCSYSRLHGEEALLAFTSIEAGRYSLNNMLYPFRTVASIAHERALEILGIQDVGMDLTHFAAPTTKIGVENRMRVAKGSQFTPDELEQLFGKFYFE